jgi:hypothetical protein
MASLQAQRTSWPRFAHRSLKSGCDLGDERRGCSLLLGAPGRIFFAPTGVLLKVIRRTPPHSISRVDCMENVQGRVTRRESSVLSGLIREVARPFTQAMT